ncbi:protein kinase [Nonomuraea sp. NPDC001636]|uniref:serine/threonine-protein kinase n=1 Tax=Nonomuraea sp. NPDC001636 TaxID=3154391 RepID=UPI00331B11D1
MAADRLLGGPGPDQGAPGGDPQSQGRLVGRRYRLMSPVGRGGMGMVWHAHDVLLDRDVAVKELILPYGLDQAGKQMAHRRMLREARSAARLTHPGIVTVHDVVEEDGRPWIVMELVRAWSLEQAVRQSGPLPVIQAAEIGIRVLDALRHAHAAGILHRDIKPGNVLLTSDRVVLTDFGIAAIEGDVTITQTGLLMGSPAYVPPERLSGQPIGQAADLWSFGATLYAAVEGRPPYEGPDAIAVLGAVLTQEPIRPQRAGSLLPVIEGLLRKNPAERLTAEQVADLLEAVLRAHGSARPRPPETLPAESDHTPLGMLPPLEHPSGPMPSRIVETPSGPVRVPYDPLAGPAGGYATPPHDGLSSPSGSHRTDRLPSPAGGFDAFGGPSGPHRMEPPAADLDDLDDLGAPAPPAPQPILPLTTDSRAAAAPARWPLASADELREHSRDLSHDISHSRLATLPGSGSRTGPSGTGATRTGTGRTGSSRTGSTRTGPARSGPTRGGSSRAGTSRRRVQEGDGPWMRGGRPTPLLIAGAVAGVAVVIGAIVVILSGGAPQVSPGTQSAAATSQAPRKTGPSPVPDGYKEHTPPGFAAAVPDGWKLATSGDAATFTGPKDSGTRIVVEQAAPQADGLAELSRREADGGVEGYIQVQLQATDYRGWKAADWEYTYTSKDGVPMHALTRHVTLDDKTAFTISFDMPELKWDDQAGVRKTFLDTFRQTT